MKIVRRTADRTENVHGSLGIIKGRASGLPLTCGWATCCGVPCALARMLRYQLLEKTEDI
jgi:hypothetical protein